MSNHKDLPPGSGKWAGDIDAAMANLQAIEAVARRLCNDFGIDFANPTRGLNAGSVPSVANPVQLKLPSLQDLDIRDAVDGDLLTFDGSRGVWVARRHDTVVLPKVFPDGDPDSYYVAPIPDPLPPSDNWTPTTVFTNYITNPSFESGVGGWQKINDFVYYNGTSTSEIENCLASITPYSSGGLYGGNSMKVVLGDTQADYFLKMNFLSYNIPVADLNGDLGYKSGLISAKLLTPPSPDINSVNMLVELYALDASGTVIWGANSPDQIPVDASGWSTLYINGGAVPDGAASMKVLVRFGGNNMPYINGMELLVDGFIYSESDKYFDGDSTGGEYTYSWTGTPHASTSIKSSSKQITAPLSITLGEPFLVMGRGFPPGATVDAYEADWYSVNSTVTADASGNFSAILTVPVNTDPNAGPVAGPGSISASVEPGPYGYIPSLNVTFV